MKLKELCHHLNQLFSNQEISDYCPNGLQVEGKSNVRQVATAVSASLATIQAAVDAGVDTLIVHHGLFWQKDSFVIEGVKRHKLALLLEHGISLIAYHLPMDLHMELGNNWRAAMEMGWTNLQPFGYFGRIPIGVKGQILPSSREEFQRLLENYYEHPAVCALGGEEMIQTVGLISGGAHKSIIEAAQHDLDAFITGSFDEPVWPQAFEERINFFAMGHAATERVGPRALSDYLNQKMNLQSFFLDVFNPF